MVNKTEEVAEAQLDQDPNYESELEMETLSLCDLPLYSDEFDSFKEDPISSSSILDHHEDDPFEFSSGDLSASLRAAENIIFCGRLITCDREPPVVVRPSTSDVDSKVAANQKPKKRSFFGWKLRMFRKHRNKHSEKTSHDSEKRIQEYEFTVRKDPSQSGRVKYRWYLLMFGSARFPVGMELQNIKTRQSRGKNHYQPMKFQTRDIDDLKEADDEKVNSGNWGLWRLLKTLSCSSSGLQHGKAMVESSHSTIAKG